MKTKLVLLLLSVTVTVFAQKPGIVVPKQSYPLSAEDKAAVTSLTKDLIIEGQQIQLSEMQAQAQYEKDRQNLLAMVEAMRTKVGAPKDAVYNEKTQAFEIKPAEANGNSKSK